MTDFTVVRVAEVFFTMSAEYTEFQYPRTTVDNGIATVTFTDPNSLNAITPTAIGELSALLQKIRRDRSIEVVVFTGAGEKAFIAGADIKSMLTMSTADAQRFCRAGQELLNAIEDLPQPTVAAVNGFALGGGCEVVLACDLAYAAESARLGLLEVTLGVTPGFGGTVRLFRRVGVGRARELIMTGKMVAAPLALEMGLVEAVFPQSQLMAEVMKLAKALQKPSPHAVQLAKQSMRFALDHNREQALKREGELFVQCFNHADQKEGMAAFVEKRIPNWSR